VKSLKGVKAEEGEGTGKYVVLSPLKNGMGVKGNAVEVVINTTSSV